MGLAEGNNSVTVIATDLAGNVSTASLNVTLDTISPQIAITSPADQLITDQTSVVVTSTVDDPLATVRVNGRDATLVGNTSTATILLVEGPNPIIVAAQDQAGNISSASIEVTLTPSLTVEITSPGDNFLTNQTILPVSGMVDDPDATVSINGVTANVSGGTFTVSVPLTEGPNTVTAEATNPSGLVKTSSIQVTLDSVPPEVTITSPSNEFETNQVNVILEGNVNDSLATVSVNGVSSTLTGNDFTATISLVEGSNTIVVEATDVAGNISQSAITGILDLIPPVVTITDPSNLSVQNISVVGVSGTVDDTNATVMVNGIAVDATSGSFFVGGLLLREGNNIITAVATDPIGNVNSSSIKVTLDTTAPNVLIDFPLDGFISTSSNLTVTGMVNDLVAGTVNIEEATVSVNGKAATVSNGSFIVTDLLLQRGPNTIEVVAVDQVGNTRSAQITVNFQELVGQKINMASGNAQSAGVGEILPQPLAVSLTDSQGQPVTDRKITFAVTRNDGFLSLSNVIGSQREIQATTDSNGETQVFFTLGSRSGAGNQRVTATAVGFVGEVVFCATGFPGTPDKISAIAGENQKGVAGSSLPEPFVVQVTDIASNPLEGIPVTFAVAEGGGTIGGETTAVRATDSRGRAVGILTLGLLEGVNNNVVTATFSGLSLDNLPATFTASGRTPGLPSETKISGVVLDNSNIPLEGVTVFIRDTALQTQTDIQGQFTLPGVPVGALLLDVDGSTAVATGRFPTLEFPIVTISGQNNTLPGPIYLLPLDTVNAKVVGGAEAVTLTMADVPGFALTVFANSAAFSDGSTVGEVLVTQVHRDKVPMPVPGGGIPNLVWTVQPAGIKFDPPARLSYPNVENFAPGQILDILSFDHDLGEFVGVGPGTVSEDGAVVVSDPGSGLIKSGWGAMRPGAQQNTCCCSCESDACHTATGCTAGNCNCTKTCISKIEACPPSNDSCFIVIGQQDACGCTASTCQEVCQSKLEACPPSGNQCIIVTGQEDACGCTESTCSERQRECPDDNNVCTEEFCDPAKGCDKKKLSGIACEDGDVCTQNSFCTTGVCGGGTRRDCFKEANQCLDEADQTVTDCLNLPAAMNPLTAAQQIAICFLVGTVKELKCRFVDLPNCLAVCP